MTWTSPEDAMSWVGLYICLASLVCTLAMVADVFRGFGQWKLWFPCRFFTINAASITLIAITTKLLVDLSTNVSDNHENIAKCVSIMFLITMLANFLPSLGLMNDKELLLNTVALCILILTINVNMWIQVIVAQSSLVSWTTIFLLILLIPWPFSVALTGSASRRALQQRYKELHSLASNGQEIKFSSKGLKRYVKQYWMMADTGNPQFVIACSAVSCAFGDVCLVLAFNSVIILVNQFVDISNFQNYDSDYKWSVNVIITLQSLGVILGSIAPIFRCLTTTGHFNLSMTWSKHHINVFRVEKHWIQTLQLWKSSPVPKHIPGSHCKKQCGIRYGRIYVLQIEPDAKLSKRILRNALNSITRLLQESEKKEPRNLMKLLEKSKGFIGIVEFDNDQVPPLHPEEVQNCWSLVAVTLTAIALALPDIANCHVNGLLSSMKEGLQFVRHVEESLNANDELVKARKAARHVWTNVEVYCKWLQIDLQNKAHKGKISKEILKWLGDEAAIIVIQLKTRKNVCLDHSLRKFIVASSMYRISQTILLHCNEQENWPTDDELFEFISIIIAYLLCACFTNLPRVITMKCHDNAIEKREESIQIAAQLLGRSKKILKMLKKRQLPNLDMESIGYIDKWHALSRSQIPNCCFSSARSQLAFSSSSESLVVTII
ncbi:hypothetical protein Lser_V15G01833 [Lactuca serriola]